MSVLAAAAAPVQLGTGEGVVFWILGPFALAGALGMVLSRNAIHSALFLVNTMLSLGVFYVVQEAPFLGAVQIIVYTEQYPFDFYPTKARYHGRHVLNRHPDGLEKCVGCELCAWACPADAIYVEGGDNTEEARFSPVERYGAVYQINYLRCIFCGLCIEACPTRSLTMSNDFELADDNRQDLIYTKEQLMAPLLPGMEQPPHPMRLGDDEGAYYRGEFAAPEPKEATP